MHLNASHIQNINTSSPNSPKRSRNAHDQDTNPSPSKKTRSTNAMGSSSDNIPASPSTNTSQRRVNETQNIEPLRAVTPDPFATPPSSPRKDRRAPSAPGRDNYTPQPITIEVNGEEHRCESLEDIALVAASSIPLNFTKIPSGDCCKVYTDNDFVYKYLSGTKSRELSDLQNFVTNEVDTSIEISQHLFDINKQLLNIGIKTSFSIPQFTQHNTIVVKAPFISGTPLGSMDIESLKSIHILTLIETGADILLTDEDRAEDFHLCLRTNIRNLLNKLYSETLTIRRLDDLSLEKLIPKPPLTFLDPKEIEKTVVDFFKTNKLGENADAINTITSILYLNYYLKSKGIDLDSNPQNIIVNDS